ncbi:formylglycine-generating enzyme family protein [Streptacidiphilus sp. P02-A3a]|nr:formylglycine-generating enzyme family protein [Streptacidiphilus sp. P02-A3a]
MVPVAAGELTMGTSEEALDFIAASQHLPRSWFEDEAPVHAVAVSAFAIDRHPVTNMQFAAFTEATGYRTAAEERGFGLVYGEQFWEETAGACWRSPAGPNQVTAAERPEHPVVHIAWLDAYAYTAWARLRLPSEAEWEYAARGPGSQRLWPWGDGWDPARCNTAETAGGAAITDMSGWRDWWGRCRATRGLPGTTPVGSCPGGRSPFGVADLSGNVQEWTASPHLPYDPARDYGDLYARIAGRYRVIRGGSWMHYRWQTRCAERIAADVHYSNFSLGFRCAASQPNATSTSFPGW